jgi:hypothetical protein
MCSAYVTSCSTETSFLHRAAYVASAVASD